MGEAAASRKRCWTHGRLVPERPCGPNPDAVTAAAGKRLLSSIDLHELAAWCPLLPTMAPIRLVAPT